MTEYRHLRRDSVIREVVQLKSPNVPKSGQSAFITFLETFLSNTSYDDLKRFELEDLRAAGISIWDFTKQRKSGEVLIRILNPEEENTSEASGENDEEAATLWSGEHTVIEVALDNKPFIIDSLTEALIREDLAPELIIHQLLTVPRNDSGKRLTGSNADKSTVCFQEATLQIYIPRLTSATAGKSLVRALKEVLDDVEAAVTDWQPMQEGLLALRETLNASPPPVELTQVSVAVEFLEWLLKDNFILMSYGEYKYPTQKTKNAVMRPVKNSLLGLARRRNHRIMSEAEKVPPEVRDRKKGADLLTVSKSSYRATVHRSAYMDIISIKKINAKKQVVGEYRFTGLFTSKAYSRSVFTIPLLAKKVNAILRRSGYGAGTHNQKALIHILETFPRDELFQITDEDLLNISRGILQLQERKQAAFFARRDQYDRYISCFVYIPRESMTTQLRLKIQDMLIGSFNGRLSSYYLSVSDSPLARLHCIIATDEGIPKYDSLQIQNQIADLAESWRDKLQKALRAQFDNDTARRLLDSYHGAFSAAYQEFNTAEEAVEDIIQVEKISQESPHGVSLIVKQEEGETSLHLKVYNYGHEIPISDILPVLENMGLDVISEVSFDIHHHTGAVAIPGSGSSPGPQDSKAQSDTQSDTQTSTKTKTTASKNHIYIHDFNIANTYQSEVDVGRIKHQFEEAFLRIWNGEVDNDSFNELILNADLSWEKVLVLRAYFGYLRQADFPLSRTAIARALAHHGDLAQKLVRLFEVRFNPKFSGKRDNISQSLTKEILDALKSIPSLDEDRIFRAYINLINRTLRTNFYQAGVVATPLEKPLAFKFDSKNIDVLPQPRPAFEIYVYSPLVEGVHLRGGKIARGGIRWSDRLEDFRSEVLGLVKAQMVKNAVIVPQGSKGGFVVKQASPEDDRQARQDLGIKCYKQFISALLDITDNTKGGRIIKPKDVISHDGDDPYLVVAADKGTATFSDIANEIALSRGFWMGDGFASGGSAGYDHKKMGITARGAWVAVHRHFLEKGLDVQKDPVTIIGVGDMGGDVFGNGLLLSKSVKLVAAFNHLHIFVDPDPDPIESHKERTRLFKNVSGWGGYDTKLLSKGGRIYDRSAKSLKLTKEIKELLNLSDDTVAPNELMRAILKHSADLLWFGGIGTYIKSSAESHQDADDRGNDHLRINADELTVKVVGEGANLGMTQRARIEFARNGGCLNTDAIDNSAGVDCSDHEVNIKILLYRAIAAKKLSLPARDKLLEDMTDEVAQLVLTDNFQQTQNISMYAERAEHQVLESHRRQIQSLEKSGLLNPELEFLPSSDDFDDLARRGMGVSRPEYSVLLAYSKIALYDDMIEMPILKEPILEPLLVNYFPEPLRKKYSQEIAKHPLRREIIATMLTNSMINRMGANFISRLQEKTKASTEDIVTAYLLVTHLYSADETYAAIEALYDKVDPKVQYELLFLCRETLKKGVLWFLTKYPQALRFSKVYQKLQDPFATLYQRLPDILENQDHYDGEAKIQQLTQQGIPKTLARQVVLMARMEGVFEITHLAVHRNLDPIKIAKLYYSASNHFGLFWLSQRGQQIAPENEWQYLAVDMMLDEIKSIKASLNQHIIADLSRHKEGLTSIDPWLTRHPDHVKSIREIIESVRESSVFNISALTVALGKLRLIIEKMT